MALTDKTVGAAGADYATGALAEAAMPIDPAVTDPWRITFIDGNTYAPWTHNVSNASDAPHEWTVQDANWHAGSKATGTMVRDTGGAMLSCSTRTVKFSKLRFENTRNSPMNISATGIIVERCVFLKNTSTGGATTDQLRCGSSGGTQTVRSCIFTSDVDAGGGASGYHIYILNGGTVNIYHNVFNTEDGGNYGYTMNIANGNTANVYGCVFLNTYNSGLILKQATGTKNVDYNLTIDGTEKGTNGWSMADLTLAETDICNDPQAGDCTLKSTFAAYNYINAGNNVTGTVDISGNSWTATKQNIGPWQDYPAAPTVDATPAPNATYTVGDSFNVDHAATGTGTLTFDISAGAVPSGTSLTGATGVVAGTLTTAEAGDYTLRVTDAWSQTGTRQFTTEVVDPPSFGVPGGYERSAKLSRRHFRHAGPG